MKTILFPFALIHLFTISVFSQYVDTISCGGGALEYVINYNQQTCDSSCNGSYEILILTGVGPYTYSITGPNSYSNNTATDSLLCPGSYSTTVTDVGQGISCVISFDIIALSSINYTINITHPTSTNPCNGIAEIILTGGVPPYSYQWYTEDTIPIAGETSYQLDSLCNGTYFVKYWDSTPSCGLGTGGCGSAGSEIVMVAIYDPLVLTVTQFWFESCPGACDAGFQFQVSGGSGNYTFNYPVDTANFSISGSGYVFPFCSFDDFFEVWDDVGGYDNEYVSITGWPIVEINVITTDEYCLGACDGSIYFENTSSFYQAEYSIDGGASWQASPVFSNLCPNSYNCFASVDISGTGTPCILDLGTYFIQSGNNLSNSGTDVQIACDSYTWIDGITYTTSTNTPTWILTNQAGCDSVVTLNLTINNSSVGVDIQTACDSYTWIDGITYTTSNNTATWILPNSTGCDSVVTLDLTIGNTSSIIKPIVCNDTSYTSPSGNYIWTSSGTYSDTIPNSVGCDSVIRLNGQNGC